MAVVASDPSQAAVDATFQSPDGRKLTIRYDLAMGQTFVKTEPRDGAPGTERRGSLPVPRPSRLLRRRHRDRCRRRSPWPRPKYPARTSSCTCFPTGRRSSWPSPTTAARTPGSISAGRGERKARPLQPNGVRQGRQDLGGGPPGPRGLAPARRDQGGCGQDRRAGLDRAVFRPVASRLAIPRPLDRQLGNGCADEKRRVPQVRAGSALPAHCPPIANAGPRSWAVSFIPAGWTRRGAGISSR